MMTEEYLKKLKIIVKGGGSLIAQRVEISCDERTAFIICGSEIVMCNLKSGLQTKRFVSPSGSTFCAVKSLEDPVGTALVFTTAGEIFHVNFVPDVPEILITKQLNLEPKNWSPISSFYTFLWPTWSSKTKNFFALAHQVDSLLPSLLTIEADNHLFMSKTCHNIVENYHSISCNESGSFLAAIQDSLLYVRNCFSKEYKWHHSGNRKMKCVAVHPSEGICATGDESGRILLWSNVFSRTPPKNSLHWHTLPVNDLIFSIDGARMYSGGGECTLVKWDVDRSYYKTVPRMGLPIRHISVSRNNTYVAVSHADNRIQFLDSSGNIVQSFQNITQCYIPDGSEDPARTEASLGGSKIFQAGLNYNPRNKAIIMNGRPGHLQAYSTLSSQHLYELDVTQQNFITAERHKIIPNTEVCKTAVSSAGLWLCTAEVRLDGSLTTELRIKFWKFDDESQQYTLNTSVDWSHEININDIKIQSTDDTDLSLIAVSVGADKNFKVWGLNSDKSIHGKSEWWNCIYSERYKDYSMQCTAFPSDGSVFLVAAESVLTIWDSGGLFLLSTLSHPKIEGNIQQVTFGRDHCSHLIVSCTTSTLAIWDVITSSLLWAIPFDFEYLVADPFSHTVAIFCKRRMLFFIRPDRPKPLAVHKNVSSCKVISAVFVPDPSLADFGAESSLFFINSAQELCTMLPSEVLSREKKDTISIKGRDKMFGMTPFAKLMAEKTVKIEDESGIAPTKQMRAPSQKILRDIMDASPHSMPSISYFCSHFLQAVSLRSESDEKKRLMKTEKLVKSSHKKKKTKKLKKLEAKSTELEPIDQENNVVICDVDEMSNEDISWLKSVYS